MIRGDYKMNFHSKKTKKIISTTIIILLILSMTLPMVIGALR